MLRVKSLTKSFGTREKKWAVRGVSFSLEEAEMLVLLGPSGCGKTTTLRMIGGFTRPDGGEIWLGRELLFNPHKHTAPEKRKIGFVFQDYALFPHLNVRDNVCFGLRHWDKEAREARGEELLGLVGLAGLGHRMPTELSGGEQQRVALARSLALQPSCLLLDEPFSNLDEKLRARMRREIRALLKQQGVAAIWVTHNQQEALALADRIAVMADGKIQQLGTPEQLYNQPCNVFVAQFLGRTNILSGQATGWSAETRLGHIPLTAEHKGEVLLSLRPESILLKAMKVSESGEYDTVVGEIVDREYFGYMQHLVVKVNGVELHVHADLREKKTPGDFVRLRFVEPAVVVQTG